MNEITVKNIEEVAPYEGPHAIGVHAHDELAKANRSEEVLTEEFAELGL